jgi:hypothetical protein
MRPATCSGSVSRHLYQAIPDLGGPEDCRRPSRILAHDRLEPGLAKRLFLRYYRDFKATSRADGKLWTL